eukprot:scaffold306183_cov19-Tisochrysis_lutea.AAC.1
MQRRAGPPRRQKTKELNFVSFSCDRVKLGRGGAMEMPQMQIATRTRSLRFNSLSISISQKV